MITGFPVIQYVMNSIPDLISNICVETGLFRIEFSQDVFAKELKIDIVLHLIKEFPGKSPGNTETFVFQY